MQQTKASPRLMSDLMRSVRPLTVQLLATTMHVSWGTAHPPFFHWVPIWEVANTLSPHIFSHFHSPLLVSLVFRLQKTKEEMWKNDLQQPRPFPGCKAVSREKLQELRVRAVANCGERAGHLFQTSGARRGWRERIPVVLLQCFPASQLPPPITLHSNHSFPR